MEEDVQQKIIKTAVEMFFRLGIRSVSIDDICRELGMSKKTFYVYFSSKDELVEQMLQANVDHMASRAKQLLAQNNLRGWVSDFIKRQKEENNDVRRVPQLVFDLKKYYPRQFAEYQHKAFEQEKTHIRSFLDQGIESGLLRADINKEYTAVLFAKIHNDAIRDLEEIEGHGINFVQLTKAAMDIFLRGVLSEEGLKLYNEQ